MPPSLAVSGSLLSAKRYCLSNKKRFSLRAHPKRQANLTPGLDIISSATICAAENTNSAINHLRYWQSVALIGALGVKLLDVRLSTFS